MARTQHRSVRIGDDDWTDFLMVAARNGKPRGAVVRRLIRLYINDAALRAVVGPMPDPLTEQDQ